jgi:hypothetical protein
MALVKSAAMTVAVIFGLTLAVFFWWEVAELIRRTGWSSLVEQRLALASLALGECATFVGGGALLALLRHGMAGRSMKSRFANGSLPNVVVFLTSTRRPQTINTGDAAPRLRYH